MKKLILIVLMVFSFVACESSEAKVYKGTLFMSFVDDFESGKSEEIYELKLDSGIKQIIFAGKPPMEVKDQIGQEVAIEGSETEEGHILFEKLSKE